MTKEREEKNKGKVRMVHTDASWSQLKTTGKSTLGLFHYHYIYFLYGATYNALFSFY
jgi:hypothetical protein